jgi:hypothetical protein
VHPAKNFWPANSYRSIDRLRTAAEREQQAAEALADWDPERPRRLAAVARLRSMLDQAEAAHRARIEAN